MPIPILIDSRQVLALLSAHVPELSDGPGSRAPGLLHSALSAFARATNAALRAGDAAAVRRHFELADEILRDAAPDVARALAVSYLDDLALCGRTARRIEARGLLSPRLRQALEELEAAQTEPQRGNGE